MQQGAGNRAVIGTTRVGAGGDCIRVQDLGPYLAAIEGTLPGSAAEGDRFWGSVVGVCVGALKVGDDLEFAPEDTSKERGLGPGTVDRPRSACARRQADVTLSACRT